jgi:hypothetical protein
MISNLIVQIKYKSIFLVSWIIIFILSTMIYFFYLNKKDTLHRIMLGLSLLTVLIIVYVIYNIYILYDKASLMSKTDLTLEIIKIISSN